MVTITVATVLTQNLSYGFQFNFQVSDANQFIWMKEITFEFYELRILGNVTLTTGTTFGYIFLQLFTLLNEGS